MLTFVRNSARRSLILFVWLCASSATAVATTYYVDASSGNDANSGTASSQAWRSLNKVNSSVQGTGHDVLLKSGSVFDNQALSVTWNGAEQDWINVGCYKLNTSGAAIDCTTSDVKPEINGTLEPHCAPSNTCLKDSSGAIPRSSYSGLIDVSANYVAIRNLKLRDTAGKAVVFHSDGTNRRHHLLVENLVATHMHSDILTIGRFYQHGIVRNVTASEYGLCSIYRYVECTGGGWGGGIVLYDSPNAMMLFENNLVHDGFGEAFNCLRSSHVVMRGNRAGNLHSNAYYLDHCSNTVVENNIAWGDLGGRWGANRAFAGVNINNEDYGNGSTLRSSVNNIVRNNLITGLGYCMDAGQWGNAVKSGLKLGFHFYGNTCVALQRQNIAVYSTTNVDRILVQNNIFYSPNSIEGSCNLPRSGAITFQSNLWDERSVSSPCSSDTDLHQDPQFVTSLSNFELLNSSNLPRASHFSLSTNSPVWGRGSTINVNGVLSLVDLLPFKSMVKDSRCEVSTNGLGQDFFCVDRRTPPSIGALDRSKYPPKPPIVLTSGG